MAWREVEEVSNFLDEEIAVLAREMTRGHHEESVRSRSGVKALLHSRGLNMRHLSELVALLDADSAARAKHGRLFVSLQVCVFFPLQTNQQLAPFLPLSIHLFFF